MTLVIVAGIACHWIAWRFKLPAIVLFALAGLIAGPLMHWVDPQEDFGELFKPFVSLGVAVILFEGGLNLKLHELDKAASGVRRLVILGAPLTLFFGTVCAHFIGGLSIPVSMVFAAIIVVTGPTVIMPLLRQAQLNNRTASYLKWEAIINDPIGALLAVLIYQYFVNIDVTATADQIFVSMGWAVLMATAIGVVGGYLLGRAFQRVLVPEFLKAPVTLALVLLVFVTANQIQHEAGLLSVTVMGLVLGNMELPSLDEMRRFKEYIVVMLVSVVFVLLTADLDPEVLIKMDWHHGALVVAVLFFVRPASVFLATIFTDMDWKNRLLVAWIGPRGIVAAAVGGVFGVRMMEAGYADADLLVPIIFSVIFATVILHGFSIGRMARWLGLSGEVKSVLIVGASPWSIELARTFTKDLDIKTIVADSSWHRLRDARMAGVPIIYGEILSEGVQQELELNNIGTLLAATSNDAYNALVCSHFASELEHDRVFQLPMYAQEDEAKPYKALSRANRGIAAFSQEAQYEELWRKHYQHWEFNKTRITDSYSFDNFTRDLPTDSIVIAVLRAADDSLIFHAPHHPVRPREGDVMIYYAPRRTEELARRRKQEMGAERDEPAEQEELPEVSPGQGQLPI